MLNNKLIWWNDKIWDSKSTTVDCGGVNFVIFTFEDFCTKALVPLSFITPNKLNETQNGTNALLEHTKQDSTKHPFKNS